VTVEEPPFVLDQKAFDTLPVYQTSIPTGPRPGFRWKRAQLAADGSGAVSCWWMGEAFELPEAERFDRWGHELIGIRWRKLHVTRGTS